MRYCQECGAEVAPDDMFCAFCGIALVPIAVPTAAQNSTDSSPSAVAEIEEPRNNGAPQIETPAPVPQEITGDFSVPEPLQAETNEPETVLRSDPNLSFTQTVGEGSKAPQLVEINETPQQTVLPHYEKPAAAQADESHELYIATIPNVGLESLSHEAGVPIEELRQDEIDVNEPTRFSSGQQAETTGEVKIESKPETGSILEVPPQDEITEPVAFDEHDASEHKTLEPEASESAQLEIPETAPKAEAKNLFDDKTLISTPLPSEKPIVDELISNPSDAAVPRATEANQSKDTPGSKSPKLKPLDDGTVLNKRYEIIRRIGGGGMGAVYLASDRNLGGVMRAVKEMIQAYVDEAQHEKAVEDFRREALLLSSLEHPAIPTIYDYFVDNEENRFYLVMKYISGGDLAARFRSSPTGKIDELTMTEWAIQIADVLDYLHNHEPPIVYRDLKPSNVMIDGKTGRVMLVDFGIARWVNKEEKGNTAVGTMGYAPSEQYAGNSEARSDIYALGATMFHLLTGADPQNNPLLIFDFTKNPRPRAINPNLSVEMERILMKAVEYNANMRYSSAADMRSVLLDHLERIRSGKLTFAPPEAESQAPTVLQSQPAVALKPVVGTAFCGFCGERIAANDMFCAYCGSRQPEADRIQAAAQAAFPTNAVKARLVVETGAFDQPAFVLEKDTNILGREDRRSNIFPEVDLTKYDVASPKISRRHARIFRQGSTFMIEDLGSANGTTLVSPDSKTTRLLAHQPHVLMHGDKLKLGETTLHFFVN
ncbi:MAG: protein kinase [Acidobacteriota bacterium]|nr:protein kinase [Acidobacteriota bacterium]